MPTPDSRAELERSRKELLARGRDLSTRISTGLDQALNTKTGIKEIVFRGQRHKLDRDYINLSRDFDHYDHAAEEFSGRLSATHKGFADDTFLLYFSPVSHQREALRWRLHDLQDQLLRLDSEVNNRAAIIVATMSLATSFFAIYLTGQQIDLSKQQDIEIKSITEQFDDRMQSQIDVMNKLDSSLHGQAELLSKQLTIVKKQDELNRLVMQQAPEPKIEFNVTPKLIVSSPEQVVHFDITIVVSNAGTKPLKNFYYHILVPKPLTQSGGDTFYNSEKDEFTLEGAKYTRFRGHTDAPVYKKSSLQLGKISLTGPPADYLFLWKIDSEEGEFPKDRVWGYDNLKYESYKQYLTKK